MRLTFDVDDRIHMDYLAYLFERDTSGAYIVTARNCFGKLIIGHTQAASLPPKEACGKFAVTFILPINEATQNFQNKFIYLSAQATKQLNISPHQLSYVTHSGEGEGLLFYGNVILPFVDRFPKDTELYKIITTKLSDLSEQTGEEAKDAITE